MPVNTSNDYITTEELNALAEVAYSPAVFKSGEVQELDRIGYPTFDYAMSQRPTGEGQSILGGYRFEVAGNRNQRHQWIHGTKKLKFEQHFTPFHLDFYLGKGHFGDQMAIDFVERAGIPVKYSSEIREGGVSRERQGVIFNVLHRNKKDIDNAVKLDLARRFWTANTDEPDCFYGIDYILPCTSNSAGDVGGVSRSLDLMRHNLITGVTVDNVEVAFAQMERFVQDGNGGNGSMVDWIVCGDNWFDMLVNLYKGTSALRGKFDINVGYDAAQKLAGKFRIGLPTDAFVGPNGVLMTREPLFRKLDGWENPAVKWADRCYWMNFSHLFLMSEKHIEMVNHGMPYDQLVNYGSAFSSLCVANRAPRAQGVLVKN